jgi:hypothetical protein
MVANARRRQNRVWTGRKHVYQTVNDQTHHFRSFLKSLFWTNERFIYVDDKRNARSMV